jgi:hypothetical protein
MTSPSAGGGWKQTLPIVALRAVLRFTARTSGRGSPFHSLGRKFGAPVVFRPLFEPRCSARCARGLAVTGASPALPKASRRRPTPTHLLARSPWAAHPTAGSSPTVALRRDARAPGSTVLAGRAARGRRRRGRPCLFASRVATPRSVVPHPVAERPAVPGGRCLRASLSCACGSRSAALRPNPSLERRPSTAGRLARGTAKVHHRFRGQGVRPLRAPQLER